MERKGFGALNLLINQPMESVDRRGTDDLLGEDLLQGFAHINQSMATIYQTLAGRSRVGGNFS